MFVLLMCGVVISPLFLVAQNNDGHERVDVLKVSFITKKLNLTVEEAQIFWPVYNAYDDAMSKLRKERKADLKDFMAPGKTLTDKDYEQFVDNQIIYQQQELDIKKLYHSKFKQVLPMQKVAQLYRAEEQFKKYLLDEIKKRQGSQTYRR